MYRGMIAFFVLILAAGILGGCTAPEYDHGPEIDQAAAADAIRARSAEWLELAQTKDYATICENIYLPDAETMFDGDYLVGKDAIQANQEKEAIEKPDSVVNWTISGIEVAASGDLAFERGSWNFDPDGDGEAAEEIGQYLTVWKKVDGSWRCAFDAGTTIKREETTKAE